MLIKNLPFFFFFIGIVGFFNFQNINAQTVILTSDKDSISVGDIIHLNVKVQLNEEVDEILSPDSSFFPNELSLLNVEQFTLTDFSDSLSYKVQFFRIKMYLSPHFQLHWSLRMILHSSTAIHYNLRTAQCCLMMMRN